MGKQIRFYQTQSDEETMFRALSDMGLDVYMYISAYYLAQRPDVARMASDPISYDESRRFNDKILLITTTSLYNKKRPLIRLCDNSDPAVEFVRCMQIKNAGGYIDHGRFWLDSVLYENKELVSVYNKLVKYVKTHYTYCPKLGAYVGKDAYEKWKNKEFNIRYSFDEYGN